MTSNDTVRRLPSTAELRQLVRAAPKTPGRADAITGLVEQRARGLNRLLTDLATDESVDQPMRLEAVTALGRESTPTALRGLRAAVEADDPTVRQRAIACLGKTGAAADVELLKAIRTGNPQTHRVLRAAKLMLSYRQGLGEYRLDVPTRVCGADEPGAVEIAVRRLSAAAAERVAVSAPGIDRTREGAVRLRGGNDEHVLAVTSSVARRLTEQQALPAVLLSKNIETGRYEPGYYFVTDPAAEERFHIHGLRPGGRPALYGTGTIENGVVHFEVKAMETPLEPPLTVTGTYTVATGEVDFEVAIAEPRLSERQLRMRKTPRQQGGPIRR
jgi:hypothetical protein